MHFAVLGSGLSGSLAALMLAERGHAVDLYDEREAPLLGASRNCEGKLHLGFVYALDRSRRTVCTMMRGALTFLPILSRYVDAAAIEASLSDPFVYAVVADSMASPAEVEAHFACVEEVFGFMGRSAGADYPGNVDGPLWQKLGRQEIGTHFDDRHVVAAYRTRERAIDPGPLAENLARALAQAPRITAIMGARILAVGPARAGYLVTFCKDGARSEARYDRIVNAAWQGRLALDRCVLPAPERPVIHRFKAGFFAETSAENAPPSVTFVTGPYGDFVKYPRRAYQSWYPACLLRQERGLSPERPAPDVGAGASGRMLAETQENLARLMPGLVPWSRGVGPWQPIGGYITSWGEEGIEDPASELHERYRIGPHGTPTYQSIDTGKFTTAPLFAEAAVRRLEGLV